MKHIRIAVRVDDKMDKFLKSKSKELNISTGEYIRTLINKQIRKTK